MEQIRIKVRKHREADIAFIASTWLKSMQNTHPFSRMKKSVYFDYFSKIINKCFERSDIWVAVDKDEDSQILGYAIYEGTTLHFAYTKGVFRGMGIFTQIQNGRKIASYTVETMHSKKIKEFSGAEYNPFKLLGYYYESSNN